VFSKHFDMKVIRLFRNRQSIQLRKRSCTSDTLYTVLTKCHQRWLEQSN